MGITNEGFGVDGSALRARIMAGGGGISPEDARAMIAAYEAEYPCVAAYLAPRRSNGKRRETMITKLSGWRRNHDHRRGPRRAPRGRSCGRVTGPV